MPYLKKNNCLFADLVFADRHAFIPKRDGCRQRH